MITQPPSAAVLDAVAASLAEVVVPAVSEPDAAMTLQLVIAAAGLVSARTRTNADWLQHEIEAVETCVDTAVERLSQLTGLRGELSDYRSHVSDGTSAVDLEQRYGHATGLLEEAIDAAFETGDPALLSAVEELIYDRLGHEAAVLGVSEFLQRR